MISYENMPKICIKCKKGKDEGVEIEKFEYSRSKVKSSITSKVTTTKTVMISFPVCSSCGEQFREYKKKEAWTIIISILVGIGMIYYNLTRFKYENETLFDILFPFIVGGIAFSVSVISLIIYLYYSNIVKNHPNRISLYISMTQDGKVEIKDKSIVEGIVSNITQKANEFEQNDNVIFCPKCGEKYPRSNVDFCNSCGKDLRMLK